MYKYVNSSIIATTIAFLTQNAKDSKSSNVIIIYKCCTKRSKIPLATNTTKSNLYL